ncbi:alpha/beta hydrolase [Methylocystis sp. IM3]|uniref:alpha/beta fold hydrolase n=1 Tax=unclassified Methylocystis TaxID=2625913 RepID=UPI0030FBA2EC
MSKVLFLPGASGSASFWKPVADRAGMEGVFFAWPGLGDEPALPDINGIDDLVALVADEIAEPVDIVAQSMGGLVAIKLALALPGMVKRLVLAVTSGGVPVANLGGSDWRPDYFAAYPRAAKWIADSGDDFSSQIPSIEVPTLLLWGDADSISPVAVGKRLAALLPNARLCVFPGGDHDLARTHMDAVAAEIKRYLAVTS